MILEELYDLLNEELKLYLIDTETQEIITVYDGKNSIPIELNSCPVTYINPSWDKKALSIEIWRAK